MVNVGSKITNKVDKISTNNQGGVEYKANGYLIHSINLQFDEMAEQIQDKMPCIPVIVRVLIRKNK
jgi:hypothetical protein